MWFVPLQWNTVIQLHQWNDVDRDATPRLPITARTSTLGISGCSSHTAIPRPNNNYDDYAFFDETRMGAVGALDRLRVSNPTDAQHLKYLLDNTLKAAGNNGKWQDSLWLRSQTFKPWIIQQDSVRIFQLVHRIAQGSSIGRSDWTPQATWVHFLVGAEK